MVNPKIKKILFSSALLVFLLIGLSGLAQDQNVEQLPILGEGGVLDRIFNYLFWIFIIAATISILVSGFYFITASGDPEKFHKAKMMLLYTLIGVLVAFSSKGLVMLVREVLLSGGQEESVNEGTGPNWGGGN